MCVCVWPVFGFDGGKKKRIKKKRAPADVSVPVQPPADISVPVQPDEPSPQDGEPVQRAFSM